MISTDKILVIIPARGGSKGLPGKNIKELCGKPLICYSIDIARSITSDDSICVSTDDQQIKKVVENYGLHVPFTRPEVLATDNATTNDVLIHAIDYYEKNGKTYDVIILLQPTSPLRRKEDVKKAMSLYNSEIDMVVSVTESHAPSVLCCENQDGYLELVHNKTASGRQMLPTFYEYNGAVYIINVKSLKEKGLSAFTRKLKYIMPKVNSIDIDDIYDFTLVESIIQQNNSNK